MSDDDLIAGLYDAAVGRRMWRDAFDPIAARLDLWAMQFIGVDKTEGTLVFSHEGGAFAPEVALDYIRTYHQVNPRVGPIMSLAPGEWFHDHETFDDAFVANDPFYQDFLIPYGGRYISCTKILDDDHRLVALSGMRGVGKTPIVGEDLLLFQRIARHLRHAMQIHLHLRDTYTEAGAGRTLLDQFRYPMVLIDAERAIRYRNGPARELLAEGDYVVDRAGTLLLRDPKVHAELTVAMRDLRLDATNAPDEPPARPRRYFRLRSFGNDRPVGVFVIALRPEAVMGAFGRRPLALLVFYDPRDRNSVDPFIVAETFGLTPAEAKVAVGLAKGQTPEEIAAASGTSLHTVRSHMKSVFGKTGAHRQPDLVRLISELAAVAEIGFGRE